MAIAERGTGDVIESGAPYRIGRSGVLVGSSFRLSSGGQGNEERVGAAQVYRSKPSALAGDSETLGEPISSEEGSCQFHGTASFRIAPAARAASAAWKSILILIGLRCLDMTERSFREGNHLPSW